MTRKREGEMPMFEYRCRDCSHVFEKYRTSCGAKDEQSVCPACGGEKVEKVFSLFGSAAKGENGPSCSGGGFRGFS
jgi:putative FmdB family regulatory protein